MMSSDQLSDIHGLDAIPWWPLAPGWWILITFLLLLIIISLILWYYRHRQRQLHHHWPAAALAEWKTLQPNPLPTRSQVELLSKFIRRVAMQRYGRQSCAGLTGTRWLDWLTQHDPSGFDWRQHGPILIALPFLPPDIPPMEVDQVHTLYQVVKEWIIAET